MNLFQNPTVSDLRSLLQKAPERKIFHDVVVDYDGEVLIDPQLEQPGLDLDKFKFRVQLTEFSKRALERGSYNIKTLLNSMVNAWNNNAEYTIFPVS